MNEQKRVIEVFSAGCPVCEETVARITNHACTSCSVQILDMNDPEVAARSRTLGIRSLPAVVVDGVLADCCAGRGVDMKKLQELGLGKPL